MLSSFFISKRPLVGITTNPVPASIPVPVLVPTPLALVGPLISLLVSIPVVLFAILLGRCVAPPSLILSTLSISFTVSLAPTVTPYSGAYPLDLDRLDRPPIVHFHPYRSAPTQTSAQHPACHGMGPAPFAHGLDPPRGCRTRCDHSFLRGESSYASPP